MSLFSVTVKPARPAAALRWLVLLPWLVLLAMPVQARRLALVMGNDNYTQVSKLQKAGNDAVAMATELRAAGFEVVLHKDLNYRGMVRAFESLYNSITGGDEVVVFFAGHGVQIRNGNYLLPTDIEANSESEVEKTSYALNDLMEHLGDAKAAFSLVMVDACRDNPLKSKGRNVGGTRGLTPPEPPKGQMVVYSASRGQQALDRLSDTDTHPNSVFTREFISRMRQPGLRLEELVRDIQDSVERLARTVSHEQRPALYNEARGNFYFFAPTQAPSALSSATPNAAPANEAQREDRFWDDTKSAANKDGFEAYLDQYPRGRYASLARANIARLSASGAAGAGVSTAQVQAALSTAGVAPNPAPTGAPATVAAPARPASSGGILSSVTGLFKPSASAAPAPTSASASAAAPAPKPAADSVAQPVVLAALTPPPDRPGTTRVTLSNGDRYEGDVLGVTRTGRGTYVFANGDTYAGDFLNNEFHGKGKQSYASGDVYEGDYDHSAKTGQGEYRFANGDRYQGGYANNQYHGKGTHTFKSGDSFEGNFQMGVKQGPGIYRFASGDRFEGNFVDNQFNGKGVMIFASGDRYEGEFLNNAKNGKGVHFFVTKDRYEGSFAAGAQAGEGTHYYANGDKYVGKFANGVRHGKGVYTFANGQLKELEFANGVQKPE